ncbi:non-homologous end-joining DNA ligase [Salinisphaera orenii]|uniref:ATP-dependent DNA ligase n=1 Tax=Salinisphaera orenii YIM 95161 TaxID=1051139 RepID=A0A423Q172_9GAMM|nr:non-homologous end-joining DNA ligase [Salinisphaera halophila]ROO31859.1 ATP-dependent DNA ligase [Salinisphaera halophila YIM 95161]
MRIQIDNADKTFFPEAGYSKGDLADYYRRIAPTMLPHLKDRPLTLHRFPDGIDGVNFIQKSVADHYPDWIERVTVDKEDGRITHALANDADALVWLVDQAAIAFHVWLSRHDRPHHPDRLIFDLDPADDDFALVVDAARAVRERLAALDLSAFVMTTGSSGLHVVVPLDRSADFDAVRDFAERVAERLADARPDDFTTAHRKAKRGGRLYLDIRRNAYAQTGIAPYSVRAKPGAPIATPLDWDELGDAKLGPRRFHIGNIFRRLAQRDCPWADIDRHRQSLADAADRLERA